MTKAAKYLRGVMAAALLLLHMNFIHAQALSGSMTGHINVSCNGTCDGSLTVTASGGTGAYTYQWNDPGNSITATINNLCAGSYTVTITDAVSATYTLSATIFQPSPITISMAGVNQVICSGTSASLCPGVSGGTPAYTFQWTPQTDLNNPFSMCPTSTATTTTTHTFTVTDGNGCVKNSSTTLTVTPTPTITVNPLNICNGNSGPLNASGALTYSWAPATGLNTTASASVIASPTTTITYTVTGTTSGCTGTATSVVTVYALPNVMVQSPQPICEGDSAYLIASGANTYTWTPTSYLSAASGSFVKASPPNTTYPFPTTVTYTATGTDVNGCINTFATSVVVNLHPYVTVSPAGANLCDGDSVMLVVSGSSVVYYNWTGGSGELNGINNDTVYVSPSQNSGYYVIGTDINGCMSTNSASSGITVYPSPVASVVSHTEPGCGATNGGISGAANGSTGPYTFLWQPIGNTTPTVVTGLGTGIYTLVVTDMNGCNDSISYHLLDSCEVVWPGDANNDLVANNYDILDIGMFYGSTGPARIPQSSGWAGYPAENFSLTKANGYNLKHDDCNGDGTVDASDTTAVIANYSFVHPPYKLMHQVQSGIPLTLQFVLDSVANSNTAVLKILLGSPSAPASNVYGLAFTLSIDTTIVSAGSSLDISSSWLSAGSPVFLNNLVENYSNSEIDVALCRTNQTDVTGDGEVGGVVFIMKDDISGKHMFNSLDKILSVNISKVKLISANGDTVSVSAAGDSIKVSQTVGMEELDRSSSIAAYPNPAKDVVHFVSSRANLQKAELYTIDGRLVLLHEEKIPVANVSLNTEKMEKGIYIAKVYTPAGIRIMRVVLY